MGVVTKYGSGYKDPSSAKMVEAVFAEAKATHINSLIAIANGDAATSVFYVGQVPSNAVLRPSSSYYYEAITGVTDLDIGFANSPNALVDGDDVHLAGSQTLAGHGTLTIANMAKRAWELAGYSSDPGGMLDIIATLNANAGAAGKIFFEFAYSKKV